MIGLGHATQSGIDRLPLEVFTYIMSFTDKKTKEVCVRVSQEWQKKIIFAAGELSRRKFVNFREFLVDILRARGLTCEADLLRFKVDYAMLSKCKNLLEVHRKQLELEQTTGRVFAEQKLPIVEDIFKQNPNESEKLQPKFIKSIQIWSEHYCKQENSGMLPPSFYLRAGRLAEIGRFRDAMVMKSSLHDVAVRSRQVAEGAPGASYNRRELEDIVRLAQAKYYLGKGNIRSSLTKLIDPLLVKLFCIWVIIIQIPIHIVQSDSVSDKERHLLNLSATLFVLIFFMTLVYDDYTKITGKHGRQISRQ